MSKATSVARIAAGRVGYLARAGIVGLAIVLILVLSILVEAGLQRARVTDVAVRLLTDRGRLRYARLTEPTWAVHVIDSVGVVGRYASLAIDPDTGTVHVSYRDETNGNLKYARGREGAWSVETVDGGGDVGAHTSLALGGAGAPRIAYYDATNQDLKYAEWDGASWQVQTVAGEGEVGEYASLALDAVGRPRIAYYDGANENLVYVHDDGDGWQVNVVDEAGDVGRHASLALDQSGGAHIAYYDATLGALKYAYWDGERWQQLILDGVDADVGLHPSLALDDHGLPVIGYRDRTRGELKLAYWDADGLSVQTVDGTGDVGQYVSTTMDAGGRICMSYYDAGNGDLKLACRDDEGWHLWVVDSAEDVGAHSSMAVDRANGRLHIAYCNATAGDLRHAHRARGEWETQSVDTDGDLGHSVSLALDPQDGRPRISYYDRHPRHNLNYAAWDGTGWRIEVADSAGDVGGNNSMEVGGGGEAHVAYYDATNRVLLYAWMRESAWRRQVIDGGPGVGEYVSLALDWEGRPQVAYYDQTRRALLHAAPEGASWRVQRIDHSGDVGRFVSLAVDSGGSSRVAYYDRAKGDLKYAAWDGAAWRVETVDSSGDVGPFASLAVDRRGTPHIAYHSSKTKSLQYARWDGETWQLAVIDADPGVGTHASLALDDHDLPWVSYYDSGQGTLKVAAWDGRTWRLEVVDGSGDVGRHTSLATGPGGAIHIAYSERIPAVWPALLRNSGLLVLALVVAPVVASRFVRRLYGLASVSDAHAHLHRSVFGVGLMRPTLVVGGGALREQGDNAIVRVGGPANLIVLNDSAAVAEQGCRLTRVLGPGVHELSAFERIWDIVDLRPQSRPFRLVAMTKDGIWVLCRGEVAFKIDGRGVRPTRKAPHPYSNEAVLRAAMSTWMREAGEEIEPESEPWKVRWPARIVGQENGAGLGDEEMLSAKGLRRPPGVVGLTEGIVRDLVSRFGLDDLIVPQRPGSTDPRQSIREELARRLQETAAVVGVEILRVELQAFEVDERVSEQWVKAWQADWQREAAMVRGEGEAYLATLEATQARAQVQMILTLAERVQPLVHVRQQAAVYEIAVRLVEALRRMSRDPISRVFLPADALQSLRDLEDSISGADSRGTVLPGGSRPGASG